MQIEHNLNDKAYTIVHYYYFSFKERHLELLDPLTFFLYKN